MRKVLFLTAAVCLFSIAAMAQAKKADYSGTWTLDVAKSTLGERSRIESMTMTVAQTPADITVTTETKRPAPPADAATGGGRPGGGMGRGGFGGGDGKTVYSLDGKETKIEIDGPNGKMPQILKATSDAGKLQLSKSSTFSNSGGDISITNKETWELSPDGKTLTVTREQSTPRGTNSTTLVFVKK